MNVPAPLHLIQAEDARRASPFFLKEKPYELSAHFEHWRLDSAGRPDPQVTMTLQDEFIAGTPTSGGIGELRWEFGGTSGATIARIPGAYRSPGVYRLTTPATTNAFAGIRLGDNTNFMLHPWEWFDLMWHLRLNQTSSVGLSFGLANPTGHNNLFPADGIYFAKSSASTLWSGRHSTGGTLSSIAFGTQDTEFRFFRAISKGLLDESTWFSVDGDFGDISTKWQKLSTGYPSVNMNPFLVIQTTEAVAKTVDIDLFSLTMCLMRRGRSI
jgi:hypothetical protein